MRIVRHPNIVELKAFYYSNGERVSLFHPAQNTLSISNDLGVEGRSIS